MIVNKLRLGDIIIKTIDNRGKTPPHYSTKTDYELIETASLVGDNKFPDYAAVKKFVSQETFNNWFRAGHPEKDDVLIATVGANIGSVSIMRETRGAIAQNLVGLRINSKYANPNYVYYYLSSSRTNQQLKNLDIGAAQPSIKVPHLLNIDIPLPSPSYQNKIAYVLSAYDDLIENNTRRIAILEEMAQALYREWFVHFRFPGHEAVAMVAVDGGNGGNGRVPEGWEITQLKELCNLTLGQSPPSKYYNEDGEGLPFHQGVADFGDRFPTDRVYCTETKRLAHEGDILFSVRAPVGRINLARHTIVIGRGLHAIRSKTGHQAFIFQQLKDIFQEEDIMGGGTIFKSVTKKDMLDLKLVYPNKELADRFEAQMKPIFRQLEILFDKNANLRQTRDLLLPRLISGELDVSQLDIATP